MNKFRILLGVLALFVLLTAPAYFENPETDKTRGTFAADGSIATDGGARGASAVALRRERVIS